MKRSKEVIWSKSNNTTEEEHHVGSSFSAYWNCPLNHEWSAEIRKINGGGKCPYCSNKTLLIGFNDFKSKCPQLLKYYSNKNILKTSEIIYSSNKKIIWNCENGHEWNQAPFHFIRIKNEKYCPYCNGRKIHEKDTIEKIYPQFLKYLNNNMDKSKNYRSKAKIEFTCGENGHIFSESIDGFFTYPCCYVCEDKVIIKGVNDIGTIIPKLNEEWFDEAPIENYSKGSGYRAKWKCAKGHEWRAAIYNRVNNKSGCPKCAKIVSNGEKEVSEFIQSFYNGIIKSNNRDIIKPLELDIYMPTLSKGIEYNGYYWHSKENTNHHKKYKNCQGNGIELLTITDFHWLNKNTLTKNCIKNFMGDYSSVKNENNYKVEIKSKLNEVEETFIKDNTLYSLIFKEHEKFLIYKDGENNIVGIASLNFNNVYELATLNNSININEVILKNLLSSSKENRILLAFNNFTPLSCYFRANLVNNFTLIEEFSIEDYFMENNNFKYSQNGEYETIGAGIYKWAGFKV